MLDIIILIVILFLLQSFTDFWWWIIVIPLLYGLIRGKTGKRAFLFGSASSCILWFGMGLYKYLTGSEIIAARVAEMMGLGNVWLLLTLTVFVAALVGGFAGSTGFHLRRAFYTQADSSKGDHSHADSSRED